MRSSKIILISRALPNPPLQWPGEVQWKNVVMLLYSQPLVSKGHWVQDSLWIPELWILKSSCTIAWYSQPSESTSSASKDMEGQL